MLAYIFHQIVMRLLRLSGTYRAASSPADSVTVWRSIRAMTLASGGNRIYDASIIPVLW